MSTILIKRGLSTNVSTLSLDEGELAVTLDTGKLYVGDGTEKKLLNPDTTNAQTASKLETPRTISLSGDATGSISFDGSQDVSIPVVINKTDLVTSVQNRTGDVTLTATDIDLGNVTNESKSTMFASPSFTGVPVVPTAVVSTSTNQIASTEFVKLQEYLNSSSVIDGGTF